MKKENYSKKSTILKTTILTVLRKRSLWLFFLIAFPLFSTAQEKEVEETYLDYFTLPRESLFLHTNKTTYIIGEEIWFKVYAYDRKNENSSKATSNVYLGLYDDTGKQVDKQLILTKEGYGSGSMNLDEKIASGDYFLKVSTNWMKNFKENDAYTQKISIINPKIEAPIVRSINKKEYDVQFLPEGGHIVADIRNVIGIKAIDDKGKGTKAHGVILNSQNEELTTFSTNSLGLGKFSFVPKSDESYFAKIILDNSKEIKQALPLSDTKGIAIHVDNLRSEKTVVSINTNQESFDKLKGQNFKLLLHKDGKVKTSKVVLSSLSEKIVISKNNLFKGVNILTLFNENGQPLVERMFFNEIDRSKHKLLVKKGQKVGDSIYYALIPETNPENSILNASISILPSGTKSYDQSHNIISSIHLKPYLKGTIENPKYYFEGNGKKNAYELDILLLTQGWSRYAWDDIFNNTPNPNFNFENGITVNGHINTDVEDIQSLFLFPTDINRSTFIEFDEKGKFYLDNFYPIKGEQIKLSYINKKGKTQKPQLALSFIKRMEEDVLDIREFQTYESFYKYKNDIPEGFITKSRELLDEIELDAKLVQRRKAKKYGIPFAGRLKNITKDIYSRYGDVQSYLASEGIWISNQFQVGTLGLGNALFYANGGFNQSNGLSQLNPYGGGFNGFYIDNKPVSAIELLNRSLTDFEDIYAWQNTRGRFGRSLSPFQRRTGITVRAYTRKKSVYRIDRSSDYQSFTKVDYGFEPTKKFYTPKYISYEMKAFKEYGMIHWEPNATIINGRWNLLKIVNTGLEEVNFYIEGITSDGNVFSQVVKVDTTKKN